MTGAENPKFDQITKIFSPCNGYAIVMKDKGYQGILYGVYDLTKNTVILPCDFYDIEVKAAFIKAYEPGYTLTWDVYTVQGVLVQTWDQKKR